MRSATASPRSPGLSWAGGYWPVFIVLGLAACDEPQPRTFTDFMEDRIAMEGTLARCELDGRESLKDIECANARRAEAAIALRRERERRVELERESERKLAALKQQIEARDQAAYAAALAAEEAEKAAYEEQWKAGFKPADIASPGEASAALFPTQADAAPTPSDADSAAPAQPTPAPNPIVAPIDAEPIVASGDPEPRLEEVAIPRPFRRSEDR